MSGFFQTISIVVSDFIYNIIEITLTNWNSCNILAELGFCGGEKVTKLYNSINSFLLYVKKYLL